MQDQNEALTEQLKRKRAEFQDQYAEQTKKLASAQSACEQLKIDCVAAAEDLDTIKKHHASNAEYISSTESRIHEINVELDSDGFMEREKELAELQASKSCVPSAHASTCLQSRSNSAVLLRVSAVPEGNSRPGP